MNEEEAKKIIDNMSEQELNDFIFFALQEVEKENQKLKTELENKDKEIEKYKTLLAQSTAKRVITSLKDSEKSKEDLEMLNDGWKIECEKENKIIDLMAEKIFEEGIVWENKEDVKQYFKEKVENEN